jgi:hypothetical protein
MSLAVLKDENDDVRVISRTCHSGAHIARWKLAGDAKNSALKIVVVQLLKNPLAFYL